MNANASRPEQVPLEALFRHRATQEPAVVLPSHGRQIGDALLAALKNPNRGWRAVVVGEGMRCWFGNQFLANGIDPDGFVWESVAC